MDNKKENAEKIAFIYSKLHEINYMEWGYLHKIVELRIVDDNELIFQIKTDLNYVPSVVARIKKCIIDSAKEQNIYKVSEIKKTE